MSRCIDADAFCGFLREVSTRHHYETLLTKKDRYPTVADVIEEICRDLDGTSLNGFDNAPTIEERPKGRWMYNPDCGNDEMQPEFYCSECKRGTYPTLDNYCPHCGARMER